MSEEMTHGQAIEFLRNMIDQEAGRAIGQDGGFFVDLMAYHIKALKMGIAALNSQRDKYERHTDHTDCIYYPDNARVSTCSQYRDGWNDAMDYIFKDGKGYQSYKRGKK